MVAPGEHPKEVVLKNNLDALQKAVSIDCDYQGLVFKMEIAKERILWYNIARNPTMQEEGYAYMKKPSVILVVLVLILLVCSASITVSAAGQASEVYAIEPLPSDEARYGRTAIAQLDNAAALLYVYDRIVAGIENSEAEIMLYDKAHTVTAEEFQMVLKAYIRDYAEHFWLDNAYSYSSLDGAIYSYQPRYLLSGTALDQARETFDAELETMLACVDDSMSEFEIAVALHDAVAKHITYIEGEHAHNAYGALIRGAAVCEGYAELYQVLLRRCGIQSLLVTGRSYNSGTGTYEGHEWNIIRLDGHYYHVDVTWDDQNSTIYHAYFGLTDALIQEDHIIDVTGYALPACNATAAQYHNVMGGKMDTYTVESVAQHLEENGMTAMFYIPGNVDAFRSWFTSNIRQIASSCGVTGAFSYQYSVLGHELCLQIIVQECVHQWSPATCDAPKTCTLCGKKEGNALGHKEVTDLAVAPTCENSGLSTGKHCSVCNKVLVVQSVVDALGHKEVTDPAVAPTCENSGLSAGKHCSACNKVLVVQSVVNALGHTEVVDPAVVPTCEKTGLSDGKHCSVCDLILVPQNTVSALGHTWDDGVVTKEPEENEDGELLYTCTACGDTKTMIIPSAGHTHRYAPVVTPPTCEQDGYTTYICGCGDAYVEAGATALGHSFGEWVVVKEATETETGEQLRICEICKQEERQTTPVISVPSVDITVPTQPPEEHTRPTAPTTNPAPSAPSTPEEQAEDTSRATNGAALWIALAATGGVGVGAILVILKRKK